MASPLMRRFAEVNKEWWLLLSLLVIAAILNLLSYQNQMLLGLYTLPTLASAYLYGRRHATLTAFASITLVAIGYILGTPSWLAQSRWYEVAVWGSLLLLTGYSVGTLFRELHETYRGILLILEHLITRDASAHEHAARVSEYARVIADEMRLDRSVVEDICKTALLHDLSKLGINSDILTKMSQIMAQTERKSVMADDPNPVTLEILKRVVPILLATGRSSAQTSTDNEIAAQIIAVADEYELLTSDRDSRRPLSPSAAKKIIARNRGTKFDLRVVDAFLESVDKGSLEPAILAANDPGAGAPASRAYAYARS